MIHSVYTSLWISAGSGRPSPNERPVTFLDHYNQFNGELLEHLARSSALILRSRFQAAGVSAHYEFPPLGIHYWTYWQQQLWQLLPTMKQAIGAR